MLVCVCPGGQQDIPGQQDVLPVGEHQPAGQTGQTGLSGVRRYTPTVRAGAPGLCAAHELQGCVQLV